MIQESRWYNNRQYEEINGFEIRSGLFYDPNVHFNGKKYEIRILHRDPVLFEILLEKLRDMLNEK